MKEKTTKSIEKMAMLATFVLLLLTPNFNRYANLHYRGYFAIGGECFIWVFPMLIYALYVTFFED